MPHNENGTKDNKIKSNGTFSVRETCTNTMLDTITFGNVHRILK